MERLLDKSMLITETGCRIWLHGTNSWGYGRFRVNGKKVSTHRTMWEQINGEVPDDLLVLHKCDVPSCINIDHLYLGTHQDNIRDCIDKGRFKGHLNSPFVMGNKYGHRSMEQED
jgi:hypothetical protein